MTEQLITKCGLIEFCGDFHIIGEDACKGLKNYNECPLMVQQINNQYPNRFSPITD